MRASVHAVGCGRPVAARTRRRGPSGAPGGSGMDRRRGSICVTGRSVTWTTSPGATTAAMIDFFSTSDVVAVSDPATGDVLFESAQVPLLVACKVGTDGECQLRGQPTATPAELDRHSRALGRPDGGHATTRRNGTSRARVLLARAFPAHPGCMRGSVRRSCHADVTAVARR